MFGLSKISFLAAFAIAVLGAVGVSCGSSREEKNTLIMGTHADFPPYEFVDVKGQVAGFDIDVAERIAAMMGKKLVVKQMGFDALILSLKAKKIDFIMSGMSITKERMKEIAMVPYNGEKITQMELIFWNQVPEGVRSIHDLGGSVILAQTGTAQENVLQHYPEVKVKSLEGIMDMVIDLKYGKSTAAIVEPSIGNELKYKFSELISIPLPLTPDEQVLGEGVGIHKENAEMIAEIKKCVEAMKTSGEMAQLQQKWFHK